MSVPDLPVVSRRWVALLALVVLASAVAGAWLERRAAQAQAARMELTTLLAEQSVLAWRVATAASDEAPAAQAAWATAQRGSRARMGSLLTQLPEAPPALQAYLQAPAEIAPRQLARLAQESLRELQQDSNAPLALRAGLLSPLSLVAMLALLLFAWAFAARRQPGAAPALRIAHDEPDAAAPLNPEPQRAARPCEPLHDLRDGSTQGQVWALPALAMPAAGVDAQQHLLPWLERADVALASCSVGDGQRLALKLPAAVLLCLAQPAAALALRGWLQAWAERSAAQLELWLPAQAWPLCEERGTRSAALQGLGLPLVLCGVGRGTTSLSLVARLPLAGAVIDASWVETLGVPAPEPSAATQPHEFEAQHLPPPSLVEALVQLAQVRGLPVAAEGVQQAAQRQALLALGVHLGCGPAAAA